jgi:hypothetical protein
MLDPLRPTNVENQPLQEKHRVMTAKEKSDICAKGMEKMCLIVISNFLYGLGATLALGAMLTVVLSMVIAPIVLGILAGASLVIAIIITIYYDVQEKKVCRTNNGSSIR